jgi:hypothetical protein
MWSQLSRFDIIIKFKKERDWLFFILRGQEGQFEELRIKPKLNRSSQNSKLILN